MYLDVIHDRIEDLAKRGLFVRLAKIDSFKEENERCESFWFYLSLNNGWHQGFGGFALDQYNEDFKRRIGTAAGHDLYIQLKQMFGVISLTETKGRIVYAVYETDDWNSKIIGLALNYFESRSNKKNYFLITDWQKDIEDERYELKNENT